jgi:hypothetical protein
LVILSIAICVTDAMVALLNVKYPDSGSSSMSVFGLNLYGNPLLLLDAVTFVNDAAFIFRFSPSHSILAPSGFPTKNLVVEPGRDN